MAMELFQEVLWRLVDWHVAVMTAVYGVYSQNARLFIDAMHVVFESVFMGLLVLTAVLASAYLVMGVAVLFRRQARTGEFARGAEPMVTVQIPTYNELAALNCAKRAIEFDWPKDKLQIIIGDDSNDPAVMARIDAFAAKHDGRITETRRGEQSWV